MRLERSLGEEGDEFSVFAGFGDESEEVELGARCDRGFGAGLGAGASRWALRGDLAVDVDDAGEAGEQGAVAEEEREQRGEGDGEQTPQQHEDPHGGTLALGKAGLE